MNSAMFDLAFRDYQSDSPMIIENKPISENIKPSTEPEKAADEKTEAEKKAERKKRHEELRRSLNDFGIASRSLSTYNLSELYDMSCSTKKMLVENFLSEGTYILAGAPKVGKSFLVAQIAYHISKGEALWGFKAHKATVLYLALEDDFRCLQSRMSKMFGFEENTNLHFTTSSKKLSSGLEKQLDDFISEYPDTRLIIIDTLQKIREDISDTYSYAKDYEIIGKLKSYADSKKICLLIVHHTRKQKAGDKFDMISGTSGILGCADGGFILSKETRTDNRAALNMVSRDNQDQKLYLIRNNETLVWDLEKCERELWKESIDEIIFKIAKFINGNNPSWSGTATELIQLLSTDINPNILTRKLNCNSSILLSKFNIEYSNERTSERKIIHLNYVRNDDE